MSPQSHHNFLFLIIFYKLHGPPMLVDKTNFGLVFHNHANFYLIEKTSSYWSVKRISVFLCFSLVSQRHTCSITVYNRTATNIENTVRAVHSCNSRFVPVFSANKDGPSSKQIKRISSEENCLQAGACRLITN